MTHAYQSQSSPMESSSTNATTAASPVPKCTPIALTEEAQAILERRGINLEIAASLGVRSLANDRNGEVTIQFPYLVNGEEVNCKTRTIKGEKKFFQVKDAQKVLYNHRHIGVWQEGHKAGSDEPLLICEGEFDAIIAMQCGYFAVSVPDGAPAQRIERDENGEETSKKYSFLEGFPKTGTVIICADGDDAGANLLQDLADRLGRHRCKWILYPKAKTRPDGTRPVLKDLNDVFNEYGDKGVTETIKRAAWFKVDDVYRMSELPPSPPHEPFACEIAPINLRTCELSAWLGYPGHGKSTMFNFLSMLATKNGWPVSLASFEQNPQTEQRDALRTLFMEKRTHLASQQESEAADQYIDKNFSFIVPDDTADTEADLTWLLNKMAAAVARYGTKLFIIDPWNELDHQFDRRDMNETQYTGFAVKQLKKFARRYRVHVAVVIHPSKIKSVGRDDKRRMPNMGDAADSAHWENKPDLACIIHRSQGLLLWRVAKSRYADEDKIGPLGDYWLDYDPATKKLFRTDAPTPIRKPRKKKGDPGEEQEPQGKLIDDKNDPRKDDQP